MVGIDDLNTISLDVLRRFGDGNETVDLWIFLLACNHIVVECRENDFLLAPEIETLVSNLVTDGLSTDERLALLRNAKMPAKNLEDCRSDGSFCTQSSELLHFALYQETVEFLGSEPTQIDLLFVRELITLAIVEKYGGDEDLICHGDFADAILLADGYIQWSTALASNEVGIDAALNAIRELTNLVRANGIYHRSTHGGECFP